ncbi:MAG: hypothetical protein M5U26_16890 [Planctomycetota bacterium]|nr:hypothetical protein [Planctomycetota bacterium]
MGRAAAARTGRRGPGGLFRAYFELRFDDERVENLNVFEVYAPGDGSVAAIPPFIDSAQEAGEGRRLVGARLALSADGPGTATATLYPGVSWLLFFRSREGQYRHEELTIDD